MLDRKKHGHGQLPEVHPQLRREGEEMQKSRSNQHGTRRSRRGQEIGFQKRGKLYELLTKGEGGWGQRSQKVTGDHPVRGLRDRGWERDAAVHDNVPPRTQCSRGAGILPLGTEDCKVRE